MKIQWEFGRKLAFRDPKCTVLDMSSNTLPTESWSMKQKLGRGWIVLAVVGAIVLLAGCTKTTVVSPSAAGEDGITVSASGKAEAVPDRMRASIAASGVAKTSEEALEVANSAAKAIREALDEGGVEERDYSTQALYVNPEYNYTQRGQEIIGYRATQVFEIVFKDIEKAGEILDKIIASGGNNVSVSGTSLEISDTGEASAAARKEAIEKAREKAEQYAELLGAELGEVIYVREQQGGGVVFDGRLAAGAPSEKIGTEINPGEQTVSVDIEVRWAIKR